MPKKQGKYIIDVIPLTRLPLSRQQHFSYVFDKKIPKGSLVSIPLFRRTVQGIVLETRSDFHRLGKFELKKVVEIAQKNFVTENQLKLAEFISAYYLSPLGLVLKSFVPKTTKARKKLERKKNTRKKIKLTNEQEKAIDRIVRKKSKFLLFGPASSGKTEVYIESIRRLLSQDTQFLILLPELTLTPQAIERYSHLVKPEELVILHSKISKGEFFESWEKIRSGKARIIIGSRMAVFAPYRNLRAIFVDEEQDMSFKQWDMNPRYDARRVAEELADIHGARIVFGSATPSVENYYRAKEQDLSLITIPYLEDPNIKTEIVDMKKERWEKNYSLISKKLRSEIEYFLKNKMQTILFVNRRGMSSFSVCSKCKTLLKCPECERALVYDRDGSYKCIHCTYRTDAFAKCSNCKSIEFKNIGIGTQKIEKEIESFFPGATIGRVDMATMREPKAQEKLYENFTKGKIDILIGTQMITKGWDLPSVGLVGIIDADSLLSIPDFKTDERAFQNIAQVSGRTGRIGSKMKGSVIIQAFDTDNAVLKSSLERDYDKFFNEEVEAREALSYPPFGKLIKLIFQDRIRERVEEESKMLHNELLKTLSSNKKIIVSEPEDMLVSNIRGKYRKQILIKISGVNVKIPDKLVNKLKKIEKGWIIDIDPISSL